MKVPAVPKFPLQYQFSMHCSGKIEITSALSRDVLVIWDCATSKNISGVGIVVVGIVTCTHNDFKRIAMISGDTHKERIK